MSAIAGKQVIVKHRDIAFAGQALGKHYRLMALAQAAIYHIEQ